MEEYVRSPDVPSAPPFVGDLVICLGGGHLPGPAALEGGIGPGCAGRPGLQRANWVTGLCGPARLITRFPRRVLVPGVRLATLEGSYGWPDDAAVPGPAVAVGGASSCCFMPAQTVCPWRLPIRAITGASSLTTPLGRTCHDHRIRGPAPTGSNVSVPLMRPGAWLVPGPAAPAGLGDLHGAHHAQVILRLIPLAGDVAQHHLHGPANDFTRLSRAHRIDLGQTEPPPRAQPQAIRNVHVLTSVGHVGELKSGTWNHGSFGKNSLMIPSGPWCYGPGQLQSQGAWRPARQARLSRRGSCRFGWPGISRRRPRCPVRHHGHARGRRGAAGRRR